MCNVLLVNYLGTYVRNRLDPILGFLNIENGILLPKLFWPTVRRNYSNDQEKILKFEAEGREFAKILRSPEQFIQTVKS